MGTRRRQLGNLNRNIALLVVSTLYTHLFLVGLASLASPLTPPHRRGKKVIKRLNYLPAGGGRVDLVGELDQVLSDLFRCLGRAMGQMTEGRLSVAQHLVLRHLHRSGRSTVSAVAEALGVTRSAVTSLADRLVEAGLVRRDRDVDDRRVVWLDLTPEGHQRLAEIDSRRREWLRQRLAALDPAEQADLARLLRKLAGPGPEGKGGCRSGGSD